MASATTEYTIKIFATGGDSAAAEVDKVINSTRNLKTGQKDLMESLARPSEHLALDTLNRGLLQSIGYTGQARPAISALNQVFMRLGTTIGLTTSAIFPYIAVLGALAAIISHVKNSHAEEQKALENSAAANLAESESLKTQIDTLTEYQTAQGKLTPILRNALSAKIALYQLDIDKARNLPVRIWKRKP
jgi:hypothetical protein